MKDMHMTGTASSHREGPPGNKKKSGVAAAQEPVEPPVQVQLSAQVLLPFISACLTCQAVTMQNMPGCNYARQDLMAACISAGTICLDGTMTGSHLHCGILCFSGSGCSCGAAAWQPLHEQYTHLPYGHLLA